ncbi:MAG: hypothetical protein ACO219_00925, partial [Holophagaceae bacterium]
SPGGLAVNQAINGAGLPSPLTGPDPVQEISVNRATRKIYIFYESRVRKSGSALGFILNY